jgi:hypothetical protein
MTLPRPRLEFERERREDRLIGDQVVLLISLRSCEVERREALVRGQLLGPLAVFFIFLRCQMTLFVRFLVVI